MEAPWGPPCPPGPLIYTKVPCFHRVSVPFHGGVEEVCVCVFSTVLESVHFMQSKS